MDVHALMVAWRTCKVGHEVCQLFKAGADVSARSRDQFSQCSLTTARCTCTLAVRSATSADAYSNPRSRPKALLRQTWASQQRLARSYLKNGCICTGKESKTPTKAHLSESALQKTKMGLIRSHHDLSAAVIFEGTIVRWSHPGADLPWSGRSAGVLGSHTGRRLQHSSCPVDLWAVHCSSCCWVLPPLASRPVTSQQPARRHASAQRCLAGAK